MKNIFIALIVGIACYIGYFFFGIIWGFVSVILDYTVVPIFNFLWDLVF